MDRKVFRGKGWLGVVLSLVLCFALVFTVVPPTAAEDVEEGCDSCQPYPIMRPDMETLWEWIEAYNDAPRAEIELEGFEAAAFGASKDLLSHLDYDAVARNQGSCGNCWAWAGTGCLEVALDVQEGVKDRLSVQYVNSCKSGDYACCGGWLSHLADFYDPGSGGTGKCIPWSNSNASWQDIYKNCASGSSEVSCGSISKDPNYLITSIEAQVVETVPPDVTTDAEAIANIKSALNNNKAVWFGFRLPDDTAWGSFYAFWDDNGEAIVYDMDQFCGTTYNSVTGGGHAVLCVGYDDTDPGNEYWVMLNSWATGPYNNRPNGLFRIDMDMDYDCNYPYLGDQIPAFEWWILDVSFWSVPDITVDPAGFEVTLCPDTTWDDTLTIANDGDGDLTYDVADYETTGFTAPRGVEAPELPQGEIKGQLEMMELAPSEPISFAAPSLMGGGVQEEIAYDDGEAENAFAFYDAGGMFAVRFTPSSYPVDLQTARICLWPEWPDSDHEQFAVRVYNDDGAGGEPGTQLGTTVNTMADNWGWWDVDISGLGITITGGDFYIAYEQLTDSPDCEGLCADTTAPDGRSWAWDGLLWWQVEDPMGPGPGPLDWMIRCLVEKPDCPWLSESPTSGTVGPGNSDDITVSIDTTGLSAGDYSAEIYVSSNDPDENPKTVPVTLHVVSKPDLVITEKYEEWVNFEGKTYNVTYTVKNQGSLAAGASTTGVYIDSGPWVYYSCPALDPGASDTRTVGPYTMSGDSDTILVCADNYTAVDECNEDNNWETNIIGLMEGDATLGGCVSIADALLIVQYKVGLKTLTADQLKCADTTDEGSVMIADALHIVQWLVDPDGALGVLAKPLWESPADNDMLPPQKC